jgi:hypothetical protein
MINLAKTTAMLPWTAAFEAQNFCADQVGVEIINSFVLSL